VTFRDPIAWEATLPIRPSTPAWRASIRALYGSPLEPDELELFRTLAGREPPPGGSDEFLAVAGRRGGKSETIARVAVFEACHGRHEIALAPGQTGLIPVITPLREQAREIVGYAHGLAALPQVRSFVDGEPTRDGVRFRTGIELRVMTADAVAVSGPTVVCAIRDELAKFPGSDSTNPDTEIDASLRPALAPLQGAPRRRLIGITSAYIKEGVAFQTERDHFGRADADVLVVRGSTETFCPSIDRAWLERERRRVGSRVFAREYEAVWQDAITDGWFGAAVDRCIDKGRKGDTGKPREGVSYVAAIDPAFRQDGFALAIAHREHRPGLPPLTVLDHVQIWQAERGDCLSVPATVAEVGAEIREWRATTFADQFAFDPLCELFRRAGVYLHQAPWTATTKPQRFSRVRAEMSEGLVRLPDDRVLIAELHSIRGKLLRSGGEQLEAGYGHDDLAHAAVMALYFAAFRSPSDSSDDEHGAVIVERDSEDGFRFSDDRFPPGHVEHLGLGRYRIHQQ
jgi:hypothetical protein